MKKTYMQPSMEAYNIQNETVLAGSVQEFGINSEENSYGSSDFGAKRGRGQSFDIYDDEEDY